MTQLYSLKGAFPEPLPERVRMPDGSTRTHEAVLTVAAQLGYVAVPNPPTVPDGKVLTWSGTAWDLRDKTTAEKRAEILDALAKTDKAFDPRWIEDLEEAKPHASYTDWKLKRKQLRASLAALGD